MRALIKIMLVLALIFASTFIILKLSGAIDLNNIKAWLYQAQTQHQGYIALVIVCLLFADLFIAMPTLSVMILSGYFLGQHYGSLAAITGVMLAGISGYWLSFYYGSKFERLLVKDTAQRQEAHDLFSRHGIIMILLARAMPILPEVSACMAGASKMPFMRFITAWTISSVPYAMIAAYAGSISSLENPKPAIFTAIGLSLGLWLAWFYYRKNQLSLNKISKGL
ncbi:TVP38/TMEM64 family protein [Motilimonas pumila]|uniref:DedA family protein n=1 Tax=Motilimonas pumila TaxID=2303987 RepID=A0A418Y9W0_9GAMM|nr:VTT domain-containing protein [Motilimonas pumila]RJG38279.1 DedA family protein [Motilimonas pumila]